MCLLPLNIGNEVRAGSGIVLKREDAVRYLRANSLCFREK